MTIYAPDISSAGAAITEAGAVVTFSRAGTAGYNAGTDTWTGGPTTASSFAIQVKSNPAKLAQLAAGGLVVTNPITLLVEANDLATFVPQPQDSMTYAATIYAVISVDPLAPDGTPITFKIIGSR